MRVITNFGQSFENLEIKERVKVKDLLLDLGKLIHYEIVHNDEIDSNVEVLLNGKNIDFMPKRLDEELTDKDTLEIYLTPLGGG